MHTVLIQILKISDGTKSNNYSTIIYVWNNQNRNVFITEMVLSSHLIYFWANNAHLFEVLQCCTVDWIASWQIHKWTSGPAASQRNMEVQPYDSDICDAWQGTTSCSVVYLELLQRIHDNLCMQVHTMWSYRIGGGTYGFVLPDWNDSHSICLYEVRWSIEWALRTLVVTSPGLLRVNLFQRRNVSRGIREIILFCLMLSGKSLREQEMWYVEGEKMVNLILGR